MQLNRNIYYSAALFVILGLSFTQGHAQLGFSFDIKKPDQYDDRVLGSEKSDSKKFTVPRRFLQNTFTHYNYFFNANNKLNEVLDGAKAVHFDDYTQLLTFYNYSLDETAANKEQLDSIIYKSTTGIVLHDLRNDWIDNMYLLMGAAYYLRKQFDSAYLTFQFINYAFAKKEKDGYYQTIGSKFDGGNAFSISTKEKNSLTRRALSEPPSRNDAFIWQIRTLIALNEYAEAASLIITLKNDPDFPPRLQNDLEEVQAWWFYNNNVYDSAAVHLEKALGNATNKKEKARWEFLVAQLYEISGQPELAKEFYKRVIDHTLDPEMEIYARLHSIRLNKSGGDNYIDENVAELLKMAKRDKYIDYRDVIYYTIAQIEIERNSLDPAMGYLAKSTQNNTDNPSLRNKAFLQMGDIAFAQRNYRLARDSYDSLDLNDPGLQNVDEITERKKVFAKITNQLDIKERQDSLQKIAAMPEEERKDFVKNIVRQMRKQRGLKEESSSVLVAIGPKDQAAQEDLFSSNTVKGDWYFYNASLKAKGASEFKSRWGNRQNVDNWRRMAGMDFQQVNKSIAGLNDTSANATNPAGSGEISFDALYNNLPLTEKQMKLSNDSLSEALYILGKSFANDLEDCEYAIKAYEELVARFPTFKKMDEVLFTLYYCYRKSGDAGKADQVKRQMEQKYPGNRLTTIVTTGKDPGSPRNPEAEKAFQQIYDLFIEGNFTKAIEDKAKADSMYGSNYWTPQLMYIEAVYYIKQKQDDKATQILKAIIAKHPNTSMATKAATMIDVLGRRQKIENELSGMNVQRVEDKRPPIIVDTVVQKDTVAFTPLPQKDKQKDVVKIADDKPALVKTADTVAKKPIITSYTFKPDDKYYAVVLLTKVDMVWVNETKNAFNIYNRGKFYNKQFDYTVSQITPEYRFLLIGNFDNAQAAADYVQVVKPVSASQIVPWLSADKYSFTIISASNLEILKIQQDIGLYKQFIEKNIPGKF